MRDYRVITEEDSLNYKFVILVLLVLACVALSVYFSYYRSEARVYTHVFYLPLILAGVWYMKKAVYVALFLGITHILTAVLFVHLPIELLLEAMVRVGMFIAVAYAIGLVRERFVRAQDNLQAAEEFYRVIFEYALTALCVIERGGGISLVNREFESLSGYKREELQGKKWLDFVAVEDRKKVMEYFKERQKYLAPACCAFKFRSRDGTIKYVNACFERIPATKRCIASLLDITALKEKEKELRETCEKLAELDKMKRDFLNVAYHEMRSPLAPIVGYASLLERLIPDERGRRYIVNIERCAKELEKMINRMLELARIDGNKVELTFCEFNIRDVVHEVIKSFEPEAGDKKLQLCSDVPDIMIQADRPKVIAIFSNLISNAIKYTPEGGRIEVMVEDRGKDICACVSDTGIGIPKEHLTKIFERFYMVDTSLTRKSGSLGLGLSIVKEYVKLHGGVVWATSEVGKGSKFYFTLPKEQKGR